MSASIVVTEHSLRLFVAIDLDDFARAAIAALQNRLARALDADRSLRWVKASHMHLTLAFLGDVTDSLVQDVAGALTVDIVQPPFTAVFERLGVFPPQGPPRVLWLGVGEGAADIVSVQQQLAARLVRIGVALESRGFHPHLTLARWRRSQSADGRRAIAADDHAAVARFAVDHITLYHSRLTPAGPTYTALARATLT